MTWDPSQRAIDEAFGLVIKFLIILISSRDEQIQAWRMTTKRMGDEIVILVTTCSRGAGGGRSVN